MKINGMQASLHHMSIPITERRPGERFSERFAMYTSDSELQDFAHSMAPFRVDQLPARADPHGAARGI
jgi:hypothetical protein